MSKLIMCKIPLVLTLIILFGTSIRIINLNQPLLEGTSTRQVETAMVARNYYNHGFKLFYPEISLPIFRLFNFAQPLGMTNFIIAKKKA